MDNPISPIHKPPTVVSELKSKGLWAVEREERSKILKVAFLTLATLGSAFLSGWLFNTSLESGNFWSWALAILSLLGWLCFLCLSSLLVSWKLNLPRSSADVFLLLFPFWQSTAIQNLVILGVLGGIFAFMAGLQMNRKHGALVELKTGEIVKAGAGTVFLGLAIVLSVVFFWTSQNGQGKAFLTGPRVYSLLKNSESGVKLFIPEFRAEMTIGQFIDAFTRKQSDAALEEAISKDQRIQRLPPAEVNRLGVKLNQEAKSALLLDIGNRLGKNISGKESVSQLVAEYFDRWYQNLDSQKQRQVLILASGLIFIFIISAEWLLVWPLPIVFWIIFHILTSIKFLKIDSVSVTKKVLSL